MELNKLNIDFKTPTDEFPAGNEANNQFLEGDLTAFTSMESKMKL